MASAMLDARPEDGGYRRVELITGQRRRVRKIAIEEVTPVMVTVIDRREVKQVIDVPPNRHANGHSNGDANGHSGNGSDTALK